MERKDWMLLFEGEPNKVHLLQIELQEEGIESYTADEEVSSVMPFLQRTIRVFVPKEKLERAEKRLEEFLRIWEKVEDKSDEQEEQAE